MLVEYYFKIKYIKGIVGIQEQTKGGQYMAMYGNVRQCTAMYGNVRQCAVMYGNVLQLVFHVSYAQNM